MKKYHIPENESNFINETITPLENIRDTMKILNTQFDQLTDPKVSKSYIETHGALFVLFADCLGTDMKHYLNSKKVIEPI